MKIPHISIKSVIEDWISDTGITHEEIEPYTLTKWAGDCVKWIVSDEQMVHRIALLNIEDSRAELPRDFSILAQAACKIQIPTCECGDRNCKHKRGRSAKSRREDIVQWVQGTLEKDCHLEINLICSKCHKTACECNSPVIEVEVDRIWEMAHPEIYYTHFTRIGRVGYGPMPGSYYNPDFQLMKYSNKDYFNVQHILTDCPNVDCRTCDREFIIQPPYIEVDFERGEVLLSYLGKQLDGDGEPLIPDHPSVFEAIYNHLEYKYWWRDYRKTSNPASLQKSQVAKQQRDEEITIARSALNIPEYEQLKDYIKTYMVRRLPTWSSDHANGESVDKYFRYNL